jgi:hypothetical protein
LAGNLVDVRSIGVAIQNPCLAALDLGIGPLWIRSAFGRTASRADDTVKRVN